MSNGSDTKHIIVSSPYCSNACTLKHSDSSGCQFNVKWQINPHMKMGQVDEKKSLLQHKHFLNRLESLGAHVTTLPFVHAAYDSVFVKDSAVLKKDSQGVQAFLARPRYEVRQQEVRHRLKQLQQTGIEVAHQAKEDFEGGDFVLAKEGEVGFLGHGFRSSIKVVSELQDFFGTEVVPLELKDPYFYHLDTALALTQVPRPKSYARDIVVFAYEGAFTLESWLRLIHHPRVAEVVRVDREEALGFALNWVEINDSVVLGKKAEQVEAALKSLGKKVVVAPLDQFQLSGGSAACLTAEVKSVRKLAKSLAG